MKIRESFQKFCTLYVFSLKMNLFYKIHLQAFSVITIVLYHSGSTFGKVLYSCLDAFVVGASDYSGHLIRRLLSASEAFPTEWFLQFWEQVKVWWARGFKPGRNRQIFQGEKIPSTPSFGGEVKPAVPCRFAACKRSLNVTWKSAFRQNSRLLFLAH
jgi:hypothetical protein